MNIYFSHGKESGPWGTKIQALAEVARMKGFSVESPDYSNQSDPDARTAQLLRLQIPASDFTVLVGSSMGGYVATVASQIINPVGLFLMAPAFYLPGYKEQNPVPTARKTVIIHGLNDDIVPVENSIRFAREHHTELHLIDSDHRLDDQLPMIEMLFALFLDEVLELSNMPKILTWEKIARKLCQEDTWVEQIWRRMVLDGYAAYRNESERRDVLLRFIALNNFYCDFLSHFSRDHWGYEPQEMASILGLPKEDLDNLLNKITAAEYSDLAKDITMDMALAEIAREYVYPAIIKHFGDTEAITASIYRASYPTFQDEDSKEYLTDPENINEDEIAKTGAFQSIREWLDDRDILTRSKNNN